MQKQAPSTLQLAAIAGFALSCFGLLLYLWVAFGGSVPLAPSGYQVKVPFNEATQLAEQSDVRISGVTVGKVQGIEIGDEGDQDGFAVATLELDESYAPIPEDTRATLRAKTLLGETYVELSQGSADAPSLPEDASLPRAQVADSVQLDEIFRSFDEPTRRAFRTWMAEQALAVSGRGRDLNAAIGNLEPFAAEASRLLRVLDTDRLAVKRLVRNTGEVFGAISERQGQLRGLISNADAVFATTAARDQELREAFTALPTFLRESRATLTRARRFALDTDPLVVQLRPAARELSGTLVDLGRAAPELRGFFNGFRRLAGASETGLPALRRLIGDDLPPLLDQFQPFLRQLTPIVQGVRRHRRDVTSALGNVSAATQGISRTAEANFRAVHYLRTISPLGPEALAVYPDRLTSNRTNPYVAPNGALKVAGGLDSFEVRQCSSGIDAEITNGGPDPLDSELFDQVKLFAFSDEASTTTLPAPPCTEQDPVSSIGDIPELSDYLHVYEGP